MSSDAEDILVEEREESNNGFKEKSQPFRRRGPPMIGKELVIITEKIILPVDEFPRYNFVGKLLGTRGNNLKGMQSFSKVRISIMGRGSTKDRSKEEELSESGDPQYVHLKEPLHVVISAKAPKIEAHRRIASACRELNKFMGPVNEEMSQHPHDIGDPAGHRRELTPPPAQAPVPKIMFGVPPPGAIILNENPTIGRGRHSRTDNRTAPSRDSNAYGGYAETRHVEKRSATVSGFPLKRYKQEPYGNSQYSSR